MEPMGTVQTSEPRKRRPLAAPASTALAFIAEMSGVGVQKAIIIILIHFQDLLGST